MEMDVMRESLEDKLISTMGLHLHLHAKVSRNLMLNAKGLKAWELHQPQSMKP